MATSRPQPAASRRGAPADLPPPPDLGPAILALETYPAATEAAERLDAAIASDPISTPGAVAAVEADVALTLAVLREANRPAGRSVDSVVAAVLLLQGPGLAVAMDGVPVSDVFERPAPWGALPERLRRHTRTAARVVDRLAVQTGHPHRDRLVTAATLHDVGRAVLAAHDPRYPFPLLDGAADGAERRDRELGAFGVDHAQAGAAALRALGIPEPLAAAVGAHHADAPKGDAAYVRTADLIAHEALGDEPPTDELLRAARRLGLRWADLRAVLFDAPDTAGLPGRVVDPCPLSVRERQVLERLAQGGVYKQIAQDLQLSTSTIRTHLHNIYGKLGAVDRAQAVLIARRHGWV